MKKTIIAFAIIFMTAYQLFAQKDTIIVTEESISDTTYENKYLIKYFKKDREEEKQLWKLDVVNWGRLNPSINFEKRLYKNLSIELEVKYSFISKYYGHNITCGPNLRYYHNNKRRQRLGKNTNGFSGNYFSLGYNHGYSYSTYKSEYNLIKEVNEVTTINKFSAIYGIQRRIGNIGYIDFGAGIMYSNYETPFRDADIINAYSFNPTFRIAIGFAKPSLKRKKVKL